MAYSNQSKDSYNINLTQIANNDANNPHLAISSQSQDDDIILNNGETLISQFNTSNLKSTLITDDITIISKGGENGNTDYGNNSLNNRLELLNNSVSLRKNDNTDTNTYAKSFKANEITPGSIKIKNKDGNELVCIDTNDNTNGTIEIRDNDNSLIFKISKNGMILNVPTNIGANSFISSNNFKFTSSRADKFKVVNRHYVDQRHRIDFESLYWKTVSTQLHSLYQNESYPAKIKEYIKSNNVPIRYEYEVLEDSKLEYSKDENGNQIATTIKYERPIVKKYTGSSYIIGTNLNWRFEFTRARRKTQRKGIETEFVFDNMGNYTYQKDAEQNLITDKICI